MHMNRHAVRIREPDTTMISNSLLNTVEIVRDIHMPFGYFSQGYMATVQKE